MVDMQRKVCILVNTMLMNTDKGMFNIGNVKCHIYEHRNLVISKFQMYLIKNDKVIFNSYQKLTFFIN